MNQEVVTFSFPTAIVFGPGAVRQLPQCLKQAGVSKPVLVADPGLKAAGLLALVETVLTDAQVPFATFAQVQPNPPEEDVEGALNVYRAQACDGIVGLGGGSPLDAAKALAVLAVNPPPLTTYDVQAAGYLRIEGPLPPVVAIPTTAGTGSEVGRCSVITSSEKAQKFIVCHPQMMPSRAILDPELTTGLPPALTAATGMDALTHNIEALTVKQFHPMCDAIALRGIELVAQNLERAVTNPGEMEARGHMMIAAMMGAVAFQKNLGAVHSMAHALSAECDMQHGLANAICLPVVMDFNRDVSADHYAQVARCFGVGISGLAEEEATNRAIRAVADLNRRIGIPGSLAEAGVKREQLAGLAQKAFGDVCHKSNPRPCTESDLLMLFERALGA